MDDLIRRSDAIKAMAKAIGHIVYDAEPISQRVMNSIPAVEPKHGEWIEKESNHVEKIYICSNCNNYEAWGESEKSPYCPNCGAKMKGADE